MGITEAGIHVSQQQTLCQKGQKEKACVNKGRKAIAQNAFQDIIWINTTNANSVQKTITALMARHAIP